jgi:hypothetical protein
LRAAALLQRRTRELGGHDAVDVGGAARPVRRVQNHEDVRVGETTLLELHGVAVADGLAKDVLAE